MIYDHSGFVLTVETKMFTSEMVLTRTNLERVGYVRLRRGVLWYDWILHNTSTIRKVTKQLVHVSSFISYGSICNTHGASGVK